MLRVVISRLADSISRGVEAVGDTVSGALFEPVIRLGVTGLARSGKTVFITSLIANLMDRGRMPGLLAAQEGRIEAAFLQPQPDDTVPRFDFEAHLARSPLLRRTGPTAPARFPSCACRFGCAFGSAGGAYGRAHGASGYRRLSR